MEQFNSPSAASSQAPPQTTPVDPLDTGKQAFRRGDYAAAQKFLTAYLQDNPENLDALVLAGDAFYELKQYEDAAHSFLAAIKLQPSLWGAHKNLVIVYAAQGKWTEFDQERAVLKAARESGAPGLGKKDADIIDVIYVGSEQYRVFSYAELAGRFKMRYNFVHFGSDRKPDSSIVCESDDIDQISFAKAHPQAAAAGQRSFSLDSYSAPKPSAGGKGFTQTHATIKFYASALVLLAAAVIASAMPAARAARVDVMQALHSD
jgi:tetratricopeptide (TPR) repeat protein